MRTMAAPTTIYRAAFGGVSLLLVVAFSVQASQLDTKSLAGRHERSGPAVRQVADVQVRRLERVARRQDQRPIELRRASSRVSARALTRAIGPCHSEAAIRRLLVMHTDLPPPACVA